MVPSNESGPSTETTRKDHANKKLVVGLIGGIGAGKSLVADRLRKLGACVIDADRTGHEVLLDDAVADRIVREFGEQVRDHEGRIDRKKLAALVFANDEDRRTLEAIVHPPMAERFRDEIETALQDTRVPLVVLDAAILLEVGWESICDVVVFVDAPRSVRLDRLKATRGWDDEELTRREMAQWPEARKRARADVVVQNDADQNACLARVDRLFQEWTSSAERA